MTSQVERSTIGYAITFINSNGYIITMQKTSVVIEELQEEANEIRLNLKEIESILGKESKTFKRVERRLNKVINQASMIGVIV